VTDTPDPIAVDAEHAIAGIAVAAQADAQFRPFCRVEVTTAAGEVIVGQLTPGEVIGLGTSWIETAQAARDDAGILTALTDLLVELGSDRPAAVVTAVEVLDNVRKARQANVLAGEGIDTPADR
jgi:hypothetical protein